VESSKQSIRPGAGTGEAPAETGWLNDRLRTVLAIAPEAGAIEYHGVWDSWGDLSAGASRTAAVLEAASGEAEVMALVSRNKPSHIAVILGGLLSDRCVAMVNGHQPPERLAEDLRRMAPAVIVIHQDDLGPRIAEAIAAVGATTIITGDRAAELTSRDASGPATARERKPGVAIQMLTSGTTGPAKRVDLRRASLEASIWNLFPGNWIKDAEGRFALRSTVGMLDGPISHMGGIWYALLALVEGRPLVLLDKFSVEPWVDAVRRHRPKRVRLVPAAIRMIMEAAPPVEALESIQAVTCGTAPLPPALQEQFEETYNLTVLPSYGATEFSGAICAWTMESRRQFGRSKSGSCGRAIAGTELRVADVDSGKPLGLNRIGVLQLRSNQLGQSEWLSTTDLAEIDEDGFVYIRGRTDHAINRGGFKILPNDIADVLRREDAVADVAVVGLPDERLGEAPAAAVLCAQGKTVDVARLYALCRSALLPYQQPVLIAVMDDFPRTASLKPDLPRVRDYLVAFRSGSDLAEGKTIGGPPPGWR